MELSDKIANALQGLISKQAPKKAEHEKTMDLFGYPTEVGDELPEVEDPQKVEIEEESEEQINTDDKKETTVSDDLKDPGQNEDSIVGKGEGSEY